MEKKAFLSVMRNRRGQQVFEYFLILAGIGVLLTLVGYIYQSRGGLEKYRDTMAGWLAESKRDAPVAPKGEGE